MGKWKRGLALLLIVGGAGLFVYPRLQMVLADRSQTIAIGNYEEGVSGYDEKWKEGELEKARAYNNSLSEVAFPDPFGHGGSLETAGDYEEILNVDRGMMGVLEIPCIEVELPIYHGIAEDVLQKGVGHISQTAFPVGGEGNHTVLSTHRGLPDARLFTDLDELEPGDAFYIRVLGNNLAYEVDQVEVVDPGDVSLLKPEEGKDYVTLLTCTPYGINSHRLLVRGSRVNYVPEVKAQIQKKVVRTEKYTVFGIGAAAILTVAAGVAGRIRKRKRKQV
ncbi:MAG: class C sortase [Lachnospiraceae bacterium]|nr:class C sortase [uncultured Acetatifactor sp.]MCI9341447.1 class C sortase [Lachnospiraceae bacterium]